MGFLRKYIFPILFGVIFFSLFKNHLPKFKVLSALETIDLLKKNDKLSLVRFGDGEFDIIAQKRGPNYQRTSPRLREALLKILNSRSICVAVPEALSVVRILICVNGGLKHVNTPDSYLRERCAKRAASVLSVA